MKRKLTKGQITFYIIATIAVVIALVFGGLCIFYSHLFEGFIVCVAAIVIAGVLVLMIRLDKDAKNPGIDLGLMKAMFSGVECFKEQDRDDIHNVILSIYENGIKVDCGDDTDSTYYRHIILSDILSIGHDKDCVLSVGLIGDDVLLFRFPSVIKYKSARQYLLNYGVREIFEMPEEE